jgi:hypothetical protein
MTGKPMNVRQMANGLGQVRDIIEIPAPQPADNYPFVFEDRGPVLYAAKVGEETRAPEVFADANIIAYLLLRSAMAWDDATLRSALGVHGEHPLAAPGRLSDAMARVRLAIQGRDSRELRDVIATVRSLGRRVDDPDDDWPRFPQSL